MKVVITGTSGFIGSRLLGEARTLYGNEAAAFSSCPTDGSHIVYQDISDFALGAAELDLIKQAEVLIHAGAFTPKTGAEANHIARCNSNIRFTEALLDLPWRNLRKIVFLSSIDVYANARGPISENTAVGPELLYGLSKFYGERMVEIFGSAHAVATQILRIGHVYGPGEEMYAKILPNAVRHIVAGEDVEQWGEGKDLRSFIYIDDVVTSIIKAIGVPDSPGVINVVGGKAISISDLLKMLVALSERDVSIMKKPFSGTPRDLVFDNSKLRQYLLPEETDFTTGLLTELRHFENLHSARA